MIKFFAGSLENIEAEFNAFEKTVSVSETALTLKPSGEGVLAVRYSERPEPPTREFPKPNAAGFFNSKDIHDYLKDIETEVKGYIKEINAGKTLKGFDRDTETYFQCYKVEGNLYIFGTFTEGVNCDYDMEEHVFDSDNDLCDFLLDNCGLYPEFKIE
jgi:hypothetical protein